MKKIKKFATASAAMVLALSMVTAASSVTVFASAGTGGTGTASATVADNVEVYKIFSATYTNNNFVVDGWGSGIDAEAFVTAVKADETIGTWFANITYDADNAAASAVAFANRLDQIISMGYFADKSEQSNILARIAYANKGTAENITYDSVNGTISGLTVGYYLIDDDNAENLGEDAHTFSLLKNITDGSIDYVSKKALPTVDKQVQEDDGTSGDEYHTKYGWGETAGHAINERFQFKLTAALPDDEDLDLYKNYKLQFNDILGKGVVFDSIESVSLISDQLDTPIYIDEPLYNTNATAGMTNTSWTLTINDLVDLISKIQSIDSLKGLKVEVTYNAHLNEEASVITSDEFGDGKPTNFNKNEVTLSYSNNPNWDGNGEPPMGETPKDTVEIFTFKVDFKKVDGSGNALEGATFSLRRNFSGKPTSETPERVISLIKGADGAYYPAPENTTETVYTEITTDDTGMIEFKGLDEGTYTLTEESAPEGYNKADNTYFAVFADSFEETDGVLVFYDFFQKNATGLEIVNNKGTELPETGGIGTKLFYIGGGAVVLASGVLLVTKRRMKKNAE